MQTSISRFFAKKTQTTSSITHNSNHNPISISSTCSNDKTSRHTFIGNTNINHNINNDSNVRKRKATADVVVDLTDDIIIDNIDNANDNDVVVSEERQLLSNDDKPLVLSQFSADSEFISTRKENKLCPMIMAALDRKQTQTTSAIASNDSSSRKAPIISTNSKLTPLESQVQSLKAQNPDCLLMVQCGYRFRFFGDDATTAARVLGIYSHVDHNYVVASIPTYRVLVHLRRLVAAGCKVAVVRQSQSAAMHKASKSPSHAFARHVAGVYSSATLIDATDDAAFADLIRDCSSTLNADMEINSEGDDNIDDEQGDLNDGDVSPGVEMIKDNDDTLSGDNFIAVIDELIVSDQSRSEITVALACIQSHTLQLLSFRGESSAACAQQLLDFLDILKPIEALVSSAVSKEACSLLVLRRTSESIVTGANLTHIAVDDESNEKHLSRNEYYFSRISFSPKVDIAHVNDLNSHVFAGLLLANAGNASILHKQLTGINLEWVKKIDTCYLGVLVLLGQQLAGLNLLRYLDTPILLGAENRPSSLHVSSDQPSLDGETEMPFQNFTENSFNLCAITAKDLDVLTVTRTNASLSSQQGSLFNLLNYCKSIAGSRQLRTWLMHPLKCVRSIHRRQEVVEWFRNIDTETKLGKDAISDGHDRYCGDWIRGLRQNITLVSEIESKLTSLHHGKIACRKLGELFDSFGKMNGLVRGCTKIVDGRAETSLPEILRASLQQMSRCGSIFDDIVKFQQRLNLDMLANNDVTFVFSKIEIANHAVIVEKFRSKDACDASLQLELVEVRKQLRMPSLQWRTLRTGATSSVDYLIELGLSESKSQAIARVVESGNWQCVSTTKTAVRYHTPTVISLIGNRQLLTDEIADLLRERWREFVGEVDRCLHDRCRQLVATLGMLDAYLALVKVSQLPGFARPVYMVDDNSNEFNVSQGRNPVIERFLSISGASFIPHDVYVRNSFGERRCLVVSGPNAGGKSSYLRMIAVLALLGQIGSYVPAASARIFTRMGAGDDISGGRSTLMCELLRTCRILSEATERSLVLIDELGRGTSTHDGVAMALATLRHLVNKIGCTTLFVTHYIQISQSVTTDPTLLNYAVNVRMDYFEDAEGDIHYLFQAVDGAASGSYGLQVAQAVGMPAHLLKVAKERAHAMLAGKVK